jgi:ribosomal protein S18 acetylase RimI-like enzyme
MNFIYRKGTIDDLPKLKNLAIKSWTPFKEVLTQENWNSLNKTLSDNNTFIELIDKSTCIVCTTKDENIVGMAFLVPKGNPTEIYLKEWSYIRFVSVNPEFRGNGIGRKLTTMCMGIAKENGENVIALHTSEIMESARHIYESLGFEIIREIDRRLGKRYWLYKLELNNENFYISQNTNLDFQTKEHLFNLWNEECPEKLTHKNIEEFEDHFLKRENSKHFIVTNQETKIVGWAYCFDRDNEKWFAIILSNKIQGKGIGRKLLEKLKQTESTLNGWVIDHNNDKKNNGQTYISPIAFYQKCNFEILENIRIENEKLNAVKIKWTA